MNTALEHAHVFSMPLLERRIVKCMSEYNIDSNREYAGRPIPANLTPREMEVIVLLADGKLDKEISYDLGISLSTVHNHVQHILRKTETANRTQAGRFAAENGLI